jgi:hypothetical protein
VRFLYCGNDGVIRGKACHTRFLPSYLRSGIGLTVAMQSFNVMDQLAPEGSFGPVGEIRLMPDLHSFALCLRTRTARLLCGMATLEGKPQARRLSPDDRPSAKRCDPRPSRTSSRWPGVSEVASCRWTGPTSRRSA